MGTPTINRRDFFKSLTIKQVPEGEQNNVDDPLFAKYARKSLGPRVYTTNMAIPSNDENPTLARVGNVTSGLAPYTGPWTEWEAAHLLRRTSFGVRKVDLAALVALTPSDAVDNLCTFSAVPVSPSATPLYFNNINYVDTLGEDPAAPVVAGAGGVPYGANWTISNLKNYPPFGPNYSRRISLEYWNWGVCINDATSIREKMQQFWYHFIPVAYEALENSEPNSATMLHDYTKLLRTNALGNFRTLIKAIAKQPAMLVYLSNQYSTASAPNENFARELLELFTMGKVPTQNYTESDIKATSKVLSGWRVSSFIAPYPFTVGFNATYHNQQLKSFSNYFNYTEIDNQTGANGALEFEYYFNMLFTYQGTTIAKYICRRLYRYFVYYDIDANVEANVIVPLANLLISSNWEMQPVVKTLLKSQHFFDIANKGVMIKSPTDYLLSFIRTFNINTVTSVGIDKQYFVWRYLQDYSRDYLDQGFGGPPNVAGWKAYYQEPTYYQNWINSETIQKRATILTSFTNGFTPYQSGLLLKVDFIAFVRQFPDSIVANPNLLINEVTKYLFAIDLPAAYKTQLKQQELLTNQTDDFYWSGAWNNYVANPSTNNTSVVANKLKGFFTALLQLAEYQLM